MNTIGVLGNLGPDDGVGGQITKTREIVVYLNEKCKQNGNKLMVFDVYGKNVLQLFIGICRIMRVNEKVVVILASTGYFRIDHLLIFLKKIYKTIIHEIVIGGVRHEYILQKKSRLKNERQIDYIYVESKYMVEQYKNIGLNQTQYLPNFKTFIPLNLGGIKKSGGKKLKLCTFSRIDQYKGIDTAVDIVQIANSKIDSWGNIELDIYGAIDSAYKAQFERILNNSDKRIISYMGKVSSEEAQRFLTQYDALLFPTHWSTEGFPGTFVDALASGLPVISSYRENFVDVIQNDRNGYLIPEDNIGLFVDVIIRLYSDSSKLWRMKKESVEISKKYLTENVLNKLWTRLIEKDEGKVGGH